MEGKVVLALVILMSTGITAWGAYLLFETRRFLGGAYEVFATIAGHAVHEIDSEGGRAFFPLVDFLDSLGVHHTLQVKTGSNCPSHEVGDRVSGYFNPSRAEIRLAGAGLWGAPFALLLMGSVLLGAFVVGAVAG